MKILPLEKNKRVCLCCGATYVINGDPSGYWICHAERGVLVEGKCEFCSPSNRRWYTENMPCHLASLTTPVPDKEGV